MRRPNFTNKLDSCCGCAKQMPTPQLGEHEKRTKGVLTVWQPDSTDPPQWICLECVNRLEADAMKG